MKQILKLEQKIVKLEKSVLVILVVLMAALSFLQVFLRLFLGKSILWLDPLLRHFVLWAGFLGAALASSLDKHFALDILTGNLNRRKVKVLSTVNKLFTGAVCVVLMIAAVKFVKSEIIFKSTLFSIGNFQVPAIYMEFILPLGFLLIIFHSIAGIFREK